MLKCAGRLSNEHTAQCLNYLRSSRWNLCLLVNFQKPKDGGKRIVHGFQIPGKTGRLGNGSALVPRPVPRRLRKTSHLCLIRVTIPKDRSRLAAILSAPKARDCRCGDIWRVKHGIFPVCRSTKEFPKLVRLTVCEPRSRPLARRNRQCISQHEGRPEGGRSRQKSGILRLPPP